MPRKKKRKRRKIPLFRKFYKQCVQDELSVKRERLLQKIHHMLALEIFDGFPENNTGDWVIKTENLCIYIDPVFGNQLEIKGTEKMPLLKRLKIHIRLLKLIKGGLSISKAIKMSLTV